jgi:hypothetical protein
MPWTNLAIVTRLAASAALAVHAQQSGAPSTTITTTMTTGVGQWTRVMAGAPWPPRDSADFYTHNDRIWIGGGWVTSFQPPLPDVWSFGGEGNWTQATASAPWTHSDFAVSNIEFNGRMWHLGKIPMTLHDISSWPGR